MLTLDITTELVIMTILNGASESLVQDETDNKRYLRLHVLYLILKKNPYRALLESISLGVIP